MECSALNKPSAYLPFRPTSAKDILCEALGLVGLGKKKKGLPADSGDELDLAVPVAAGKAEKNSEKNAEKKAAAEQKKICASNLKVSGQAAKALGPLTNALTALDRLEARVGKAQVEVSAGILKTAVDVRNSLEGWTKAAREAVNNQEAQKQVPDTEKKSIGSLPFQTDSVKLFSSRTRQSKRS